MSQECHVFRRYEGLTADERRMGQEAHRASGTPASLAVWLAEHDAKVRAEEREKAAQIAENLYFGGGATGSANRWGAKQAAARIREQGS